MIQGGPRWTHTVPLFMFFLQFFATFMVAPVNNLRRLGVQVLQGITDFVKMSSCELTGELAIPGLDIKDKTGQQ